jgi:hypothetical protein
MSNIRLNWKDPATREDGSTISAAEIDRVDIAIRVDGAPDFTPIDSVPAGVQTALVTDLPPGDYEFTVTVVDTQVPPRSSAVAVVSVTIPAPPLAAPGSVTDLEAVVE